MPRPHIKYSTWVGFLLFTPVGYLVENPHCSAQNLLTVPILRLSFQVPDRGGRAYELEPPPPEMPSFQKRQDHGGRGGGRGGKNAYLIKIESTCLDPIKKGFEMLSKKLIQSLVECYLLLSGVVYHEVQRGSIHNYADHGTAHFRKKMQIVSASSTISSILIYPLRI